MSAARSTDLFYGHLGEARYDLDRHQWQFNREPRITRKIEPAGPPVTLLQPSLQIKSFQDVQRAVDRAKSIKKLVQHFPELVPGVLWLPRLAQESELICKNVSRHDPATSSLFAYGEASYRSLGDREPEATLRKVPIIAVAGGLGGDAVRLVRLRKEQIGWEGDKSVKLTNLLPQDQEHGWWCTNGSPVQQICFAETAGKARARLAVRYHGAITILEPLLHADAVPSGFFRNPSKGRPRYSDARLDANPVLTLVTERTGGSPQADVSFNPWRFAQFAIVDQRGHWTIWELKSSLQFRGVTAVDAGPSGFVSDEQIEAKGSSDANGRGDGWGTILWAGDRNTIVVADRSMLSVFSIEDGCKRLLVPNLFGTGIADWILDVKRNPSNAAQIFVLTSTRVFWLHIIPRDHERSKDSSGPGAKVLLSWIHFRDRNDLSLRFDVLDDEDTTMLVLYSRLTSLSTIFTFRMPRSPLYISLSVSDPYLLNLAAGEYFPHLCGHQQWSREFPSLSSIELRVAEYQSRKGSTPSGLGTLYRDQSVKFYYLSTFYSDLSLQRRLYVGQAATDLAHIHPPVVQSRQDIPKSSMYVSDDDRFVIPNRVSVEDWQDLNLAAGLQTGSENKVRECQPDVNENCRRLNFEWLEQDIQRSLTEFSRSNAGRSKSNIDDCFDVIQTAIKENLRNNTPQLNLLQVHLKRSELLQKTAIAKDIDTSSKTLGDFLTSLRSLRLDVEENEKHVEKFPRLFEILNGQLSNLIVPTSAINMNPSLSQIYDSILNSWISSLPEEVPSSVRIATERNVREIALQLYLASLGVYVGSREREYKAVIAQALPSLDSTGQLSLQRNSAFPISSTKRPMTSRDGSCSPLISSQISEARGFMPAFSAGNLPTPEPTPSLRSSSKSPSLTSTEEDAASRRLRTLARVAPQPVLPSGLSNILRHWSEGGDPANYDFEATESYLRAEAEPEQDLMDEATAKKRQRRETRLKRQRERSVALSSQQPEPIRIKESQPLSRSTSVPLPLPLPTLRLSGRGDEGRRPMSSREMSEHHQVLQIQDQSRSGGQMDKSTFGEVAADKVEKETEGKSKGDGKGTGKGKGKGRGKEKGKGKKRAPGF